MKWTLGPKKDYSEWHRWFAWRPVPLYQRPYREPRQWVWLEWVERRVTAYGWGMDYREFDQVKKEQ